MYHDFTQFMMILSITNNVTVKNTTENNSDTLKIENRLLSIKIILNPFMIENDDYDSNRKPYANIFFGIWITSATSEHFGRMMSLRCFW